VSLCALALAAALIVATACGGAGSTATPAPTTTTAPAATTGPSRSISLAPATPSPTPSAKPTGPVLISMGEHFFDPSLLKVTVGTTVIWHNSGEQAHDIHARDGSFDSNLLDQGGTFTYTFNKPGKFPYYCMPHEGDGMFAEIDVE
jgi:plastocyanin